MTSETGSFWADGMVDPNSLSKAERELRDRFVIEYLVDFDAYAAAIRIGFSASFASGYAQNFMDEPYVRQRISQMQREQGDPKEETDSTKRQIRAALLREAHYRGPGSSHAARVAALAKLMSLYDMDSALKTKNETTLRGGVMEVPAIANVEAWQAAATASQGQLQQDSEVK